MEGKFELAYIKGVIADYGSFTVADVEAESSPCVGSKGKFVFLAEDFDEDGIRVYTYDTKSHSSDEVDNFAMDYEELELDTIKEIYELAKEWEDINSEEE